MHRRCQGYFEAAIAGGADAFITGEVSNRRCTWRARPAWPSSRPGHHATERFGVRAVGTHVAAELGLDHQFIDLPNPA